MSATTSVQERLSESFGFVEVYSLSASLGVADAMCKSADVKLVGVEVNGAGGMGIKVTGSTADVRAAVDAGVHFATQMNTLTGHSQYHQYPGDARKLVYSEQKFSRIMSSYDHLLPDGSGFIPVLQTSTGKPVTMAEHDAIGMIETQGLVGMLEASDVMLKAADVQLVGVDKIGAAYVTILVKGDVAAVRAAVEAGVAAVERVGGKLILSHVIPRPHKELISLLPKG